MATSSICSKGIGTGMYLDGNGVANVIPVLTYIPKPPTDAINGLLILSTYEAHALYNIRREKSGKIFIGALVPNSRFQVSQVDNWSNPTVTITASVGGMATLVPCI